jgi:kynurenine formamidase
MRVYDISVPIRTGMIIHDGNPGVELERVDSIPDGAHANVRGLQLGVHSGTHVDAPVHFLEGAAGSESIELEPLIGPAMVVDAMSADGDLDEQTLARLDRQRRCSQGGRRGAVCSRGFGATAEGALSAPQRDGVARH